MGHCSQCGQILPIWTPFTVLESIRRHYRKYGETPVARSWETSTDEHPAWKTVTNMYGTWNNALKEAGLEPRRVAHYSGRRWSKQEILEAARAFYADTGRWPTWTDWRRASDKNPSISTTQKYWKTAAQMGRAARRGQGKQKKDRWNSLPASRLEPFVREFVENWTKENPAAAYDNGPGPKSVLAERSGVPAKRIWNILNWETATERGVPQRHVSFTVADKILTALEREDLWHVPAADGGLADLYL